MFHCVLLVLASQKKEWTNQSFFLYGTLYLVSFFFFLFIPQIGMNSDSKCLVTQSVGKMYKLSKVCFD